MLCFHWLVSRVWYFVTGRVSQLQELFLCLCVCSEIYVTFSKIVYAYFGIVLYAQLAQGSKAAQTTPKSASQLCRPVGNSNIPEF